MRIVLVISSLGAGGAERVMSLMANHWQAHGAEVSLITLSGDADDWYALHPGVKRIGLNLLSVSRHTGEALWNNAVRIHRLRCALRQAQPQVIISFVDKTNVLAILASWGLGVPVIISERIDPRRYPVGMLWGGLRALLYRRASALVVQSHVLREWASGMVGARRAHVIPNPVVAGAAEKHAPLRNGGGLLVMAMGRLTRQKRFDLLLRAFHQCVKKHPSWSLMIIGEGEERRSLEILAKDLDVSDRVSMPGLVRNPAGLLAQADLFVLSSDYEGFPNALLEAMACGVPAISTDCNSGPRDIIRHGIDGLLVAPNDLESLAAAMNRLMEDPAERHRLSIKATEVVERFRVAKVMGSWDDIVRAHLFPPKP